MKLKSLLAIAVIFVLVSFKGEENEIKGVWKVISIETISNGVKITTNLNGEEDGQLKTWTDNYFLFVGRNNNGQRITYGGGTYNLSGTKYMETYQYHVAPNYRERTMNLLLEVKGDTLTQKYPVDVSFNLNSNYTIEKYVRVE